MQTPLRRKSSSLELRTVELLPPRRCYFPLQTFMLPPCISGADIPLLQFPRRLAALVCCCDDGRRGCGYYVSVREGGNVCARGEGGQRRQLGEKEI